MNHIIANLETLLAKGPDNVLIRFGLGNAYLHAKEFSKAVEHFAKAVEFDPRYSAAWKGYGKALAENQQLPEAIEAYTKGIEVAEARGDIQATKEMKVFLKRLHGSPPPVLDSLIA